VKSMVKGAVEGSRVLHVSAYQKAFNDFVAKKQAQFPQHVHISALPSAKCYTAKESVLDSGVSV